MKRMQRMLAKGLALWACWAAASASAMDQAWVSWVMDGDTVLLLPEGEHEPVKFRIQGIDAPESCQPGGEASRDALIARVLRRTVRIEAHGHDSYGRRLGRLFADDQDVGAEMVRSGQAWAWSHRVGRGPYAALQREAEHSRRGLFASSQTAMSPGVFRQFHGPCHLDGTDQAPVQRVPHTGQAGSR
jgi:endonuclease YncB( thermonuclease family)